MEAGGIAPGKRKLAHQLTAEDLIGRVVLIDISGRVQAELDKNGGKPSPDKSVTDFSNSSANVVGADDIAAVAGKLRDGDWLVLNLGWSRFYFQGADFMKDPYINGFNHPGLSKAGVDKLIEVMDARKVRDKGHRRRQYRHRFGPVRRRRRRQVDQFLARPCPSAAARPAVRRETRPISACSPKSPTRANAC